MLAPTGLEPTAHTASQLPLQGRWVCLQGLLNIYRERVTESGRINSRQRGQSVPETLTGMGILKLVPSHVVAWGCSSRGPGCLRPSPPPTAPKLVSTKEDTDVLCFPLSPKGTSEGALSRVSRWGPPRHTADTEGGGRG